VKFSEIKTQDLGNTQGHYNMTGQETLRITDTLTSGLARGPWRHAAANKLH